MLVQRYEAVNFKGGDKAKFEPIPRPGIAGDTTAATRGPLTQEANDFLYEYLKNMG